jgi:enoyl-CoA hydratase/carnithine racemase
LLIVQQEERVLRLTLDRPEKRNALNSALCSALVEALNRADEDPSVGAILLTGNGKAFCAGMDLSEAVQADRIQLDQIHEQLFTAGYRLRKPIVAGVHGPALAGGTGLAANAHILVASEDAWFGLTEIKIGLWPILIFRAVKAAVGERRATELSLTGRRFTGQQALEYGLLHELSPSPLLRAEVIAKQVSQSSPNAIRAGLDYVNRTRDKSWEEAGRIGSEIRQSLMASDDFKQRVGQALAGLQGKG